MKKCKCGNDLELYTDFSMNDHYQKECYDCHKKILKEILEQASNSYKNLPDWMKRIEEKCRKH